jgi:hypothetical protein
VFVTRPLSAGLLAVALGVLLGPWLIRLVTAHRVANRP